MTKRKANPEPITLYRENQTDAAFETTIDELRERFTTWRAEHSDWDDAARDRTLAYYVGAVDGENATCDADTLARILEEV